MRDCGCVPTIPFLHGVNMLKAEYVDVIVKKKNEVLKELGYRETVIRDEIFKLLRQKSRVIFYPLDEEPDLDGFHITRCLNGEMTAFVYINTAKNFEKNIFCAAHELGHIYEIEKEIENKFSNAHFNSKDVDEIMNRFAAELLMPYEHFKTKFNELLKLHSEGNSIKVSNFLKVIVALMDYYYVPYKAVVWRLWEIDFLTLAGREKFEKIEEEDSDIINVFIYEGKYTRLRHPSRIKSFENLPEYLKFAEHNCVYGNRKIAEMRRDFGIDISVSEEKMEAVENNELDANDIKEEYV